MDLQNQHQEPPATAIGDLRVDYWCFRREDSGKGKGSARIETSGSSKVDSVVGSGTATVDTKEIVLNKQELDGGFYFVNGDSAIQSDGMGGLPCASSIKIPRGVQLGHQG